MKTALISTTINVPKVFALYAAMDPSVEIFVAGDKKSPPEAEDWFYENCGPKARLQYMTVEQQQDLGYKSSELIGWNCDSRRNIALLEAIKSGADTIISIDDDMIPLDGVYYHNFNYLRMRLKFSGPKIGAPGFWFDAGKFTVPPAPQRGLPVDHSPIVTNFEAAVGVDIGVMQGIILGVPDTDACTAIANNPRINSVTDILRNGFVVDLECNAVFNSQNTGFRRELAPAFAQFYPWHKRNTDILASVMMRRIMREKNLYTYYGPPMSYHARKYRPLFGDLRAEQYGLMHIASFQNYLNNISFTDSSVLEMCRSIVSGYPDLFTPEALQCAMAFYQDCEAVL